jgi:gamma-glutamylcyclotransferase (GGCT)/AIG2-like uncharacterized protein YtfP
MSRMNTGVRHLFVYGTLMSAAIGTMGKAQRDRLQREGRGLGAATMHGAQLYHLGRYPGLIESGDPGHIVHGELIALANPHITLRWLDDYEGLVPGDHDQNEYARLERPVLLANGNELPAWVYVFLRDVERYRLIAGGRWTSALLRERQN